MNENGAEKPKETEKERRAPQGSKRSSLTTVGE